MQIFGRITEFISALLFKKEKRKAPVFPRYAAAKEQCVFFPSKQIYSLNMRASKIL